MHTKHTWIAALVILFAANNLAGQNGTGWQAKVDTTVLQKTMEEGKADFMVLLFEQADLSDARFIPKKEEKSAFVFQRLTETAQHSQTHILAVIRDAGAPHQPFWITNAVWAEGDMSLLEALARLPEVREIQPNPSVKFEEPQQGMDAGQRAITWGIDYIHADDVWAMGYTGQGVTVAGQDTGYEWDHPAIKLQYRGWNNITMSADHNYNWHDAIHANAPQNSGTNPCGYSLPNPCDDNNHGTHTAGTMAGDDGGSNQIGVAPGAKWIGCRNMERGWGQLSTYMECFQWFLAPTDLNGQNPMPSLAPHVINNSWYCPNEEGCNSGNYAVMEAVVNNLRAAGVVVVASAGNSGPGCGTISHPPAMFQGSFSVGATNSTGGIANFSSRGPTTYNSSTYLKPNVTAPGVSVYSCIKNGGYASFSGTSMAGPHVAGAVALVISAKPSLAGQVSQIESIFQTTATGTITTDGCGGDTPTSIPNNTFGHGIIDALAAVNAALALLPVELMRFTGMVMGGGVQLDWEVALPGTLHHFEIEHADRRFQWTNIGKEVFLHEVATYGFFHAAPLPGTNYYRLKMVDLDGSIEYSRTIAVQIAQGRELMVFPNPSDGMLSLVADWKPGEATLRVFDASSRLVQEERGFVEKEGAKLEVDISRLPVGVYFIQVWTDAGGAPLFQNKFVKF